MESSGSTHFLRDLDELKRLIVNAGTLVESRLAAAMRGFQQHDLDTLDEVAISDADVNEQQIAIDDHAFKLLALHQPVAIDLRVIVAAIKINADVERVGDLAVNIAEAARRYLSANMTIEEQALLPRMSDVAQTMLHQALDAFVGGKVGLAQSVLERDDTLDSLREEAFRRLVQTITRRPTTVAAALELLAISRHLERVGDHATNVAEDVIFVVAGEDVRHQAGFRRPEQPS